MRSPLVRRTATAGALILSLSALAGCSSDSEEADDPSSSASSEEESTEPPEAGEEIDNAEFAEIFEAAFEQATTATISLTTGGELGVEAEGAIDFGRDPLAMQMTMNVPQAPAPLEFILVDDVIYQSQGQETGGKFFAFDLSDPNNPLGQDFTEQLDPRASFENFEKGLEKVVFVGEEDGVDTYALTVDSAALLDGTAGESGSDALPDQIEYTMSVDDEGFFREFNADLGELGGTFEASYDNWGEPVDIKAPEKSQISELPGQ